MVGPNLGKNRIVQKSFWRILWKVLKKSAEDLEVRVALSHHLNMLFMGILMTLPAGIPYSIR